VGAEHYIDLGEEARRIGHVAGEEHPIDLEVAAMRNVLEVAAALRTVLEVRHIGREEVADTARNLAEGEERHIDLAEGTGLAAAHHRVLGHSLAEAGSRPVGDTVDSALVVVVDTVDIEAAVRILGAEGLGPGTVADSLLAGCSTTSQRYLRQVARLN